MLPSGGTEILHKNLLKYVEIPKNINLMISICNTRNIENNKKNILWQHLSYDQANVKPMIYKNFTDGIDSFVFVSNWQCIEFDKAFNIPSDRSVVIKNAIDPIEFIERPKEKKIKLIYTSMPNRGLELLLDCFEYIGRDDVELDVYSSTLIYGSGFYMQENIKYEKLFERAKNMKNVNYFGYASNEDVRLALQNSHILSYPSIFEETSCMSIIEAGAAGCNIVSTNLGAIPETASEFGKLVPINNLYDELVVSYSNALNETIDNYYSSENKKLLVEQSKFYNNFYSWENRKKDWKKLFNSF
jgi:glycosyltransferase involved in cell wall biosynthesis